MLEPREERDLGFGIGSLVAGSGDGGSGGDDFTFLGEDNLGVLGCFWATNGV